MSRARGHPHLGSPPPPEQLTAFPAHVSPAGSELFRSHRHGHEPRWFSGSGAGRFDLAGTHGTCYTARSDVIALLETWGGMWIVPEYLVAERDMSNLLLRNAVRLADMTSNTAIRFGVTAEIFTTGDYQATQRWAAALRQAGFEGIRYWARHDLAHRSACFALFGPAGASTDSSRLEPVRTDHLPDRPDLLSDFETQTGVALLPVPPL